MTTPDLKAAALAATPEPFVWWRSERDITDEYGIHYSDDGVKPPGNSWSPLYNEDTILALLERLQVAEDAAKDGADRLDWIMQQADDFSCHVLQDMPGDGNYAVFGMNNNYGEGRTFIEALDAARRLTP